MKSNNLQRVTRADAPIKIGEVAVVYYKFNGLEIDWDCKIPCVCDGFTYHHIHRDGSTKLLPEFIKFGGLY
jgi:hypothetical protein